MGASVEEETVRPSLRWNVADITLTVVVAVASGIIFWGIGLISEPISAALKLIPVPGVSALYYGLFYLLVLWLLLWFASQVQHCLVSLLLQWLS